MAGSPGHPHWAGLLVLSPQLPWLDIRAIRAWCCPCELALQSLGLQSLILCWTSKREWENGAAVTWALFVVRTVVTELFFYGGARQKDPRGMQPLQSVLALGSIILWCTAVRLGGWQILTAGLYRRQYSASCHDRLSNILWVKANIDCKRDVVKLLCKCIVFKGTTWRRQNVSSCCLRARRIRKHVC